MANDLPAELRVELRDVFLRDLRSGFGPAEQAAVRLGADPADHAALEELRHFFHWLGGDAATSGYSMLGHLASACEGAAAAALEAGVPLSRPHRRSFESGLAGVRSILDGEPARAPRVAPAAAPGTPAASEMRAGAQILIFEDDPFSARLMESTLGLAGHATRCLPGSSNAVALIERAAPDMVVIDVDVPRLDALDVCRRLRANPALQLVPVLLVGKDVGLEERVAGLQAGASDYLAKPFEPRELVARATSYLQRLAAVRELSIRDALTRCYTRAYFEGRLAQELVRAERHGHRLTLALLDVDRLAEINERDGRPAGDELLSTLAGLTASSVRGIDLVARSGDDELAILLIEAAASEGQLIAERIRRQVEGQRFSLPHGEAAVTVSLGVAQHAAAGDAASLWARAGEALRRAKQEGRNRVCVAS